MGNLVDKITSAIAFQIPIPYRPMLSVSAIGEVATTGWTAVRLSPRFYIQDPVDGYWDFDVIGDPPVGVVGQISIPVAASGLFDAPPWLLGVRIHGQQGSVDFTLNQKGAPVQIGPAPHFAYKMAALGNVIVRRELGVFDDSIQPTGTIHWDGWTPHVEMKKLRHTLTLTAEGPDEGRINQCLQEATAAGLVAAIAAAFITGGAALPAAVSAFLSQLTNCLGNGFSARVDDESHWIYWDS